MSRRPPSRGTLALGIALGALGVACVAGGLALLGWRILAPDEAVIVPPHLFGTPEPTPTPGLLGTALPAPPLPPVPAQVVILPVSEPPTPTATAPPTRTAPPSRTLADTPTPSPAEPSPAEPSPTAMPTATQALAPSATATPAPTVAPAATEAAPTLTATPIPPTASPTPIPGEPPTRIHIPALGLDAPVLPVGQHAITLDGELFSQWDVPPARAAGWHQTSAPLGAPGNTVLNGHHNVYGEVFHHLSTLKPGDWIALDSANRRYHYVVVQTMTLAEEGQPLDVRAENARWILPTVDERVTLVTCWPSYANTHRLVVIARPVWDVIPPADIP
ncbi:MAG: sortase [Anaerolineae bacterium]|nr:sortase [Anaerolineae bacterium]